MKSILIISLANIKRRGLQSLLVGSCIALSAMLFATTLGMLNGMRKPFDNLFDRLNASHILLFFDHRQHDSEEFARWFGEQPEVAAVADPVPFFTLESPMIFKGREVDLMVQLTEHHEGNLQQDKVLILKGEQKNHPATGEIWIPNHLATAHGIQAGDTLGIPVSGGLYPLVVSATLVDPHYASGLFNPTRAWVAPGSLPFFLPVSQLNGRMLGVRVKSPEMVGPLWARFNRSHIFDGNTLQYELFKSVFLSFYNIISLVLLVFSVLAIFAAIFILFTTLSGAIAADYQLIGIYKAQGFTPGNIVTIYLFQYLLLAAASLPVGIEGSYLITKNILASLVKSIGLVNLEWSFFTAAAATIALFLTLVALLTFAGSRNAGKIRAAMAIRIGAADPAFSGAPFAGFLMKLPVPVFLGLRMLFFNKKRLIYTASSLLFAIFILVFSVNVAHSFLKLKDNKAAWGLENSDLQLRLNKKIALPLEHESFLPLIRQEMAVETVVPYSYCSAAVPEGDQNTLQNLNGKAYDGDPGTLGLTNLQGRHPETQDEIALCLLTARELGKRPGDPLELFIEGQRKIFTVTGIYQDVSNLGKGFRLTAAAMRELNPLFQPELYAIRLREGARVEAAKDHFQRTFDETVVLELSVEERREIQSTIANMRNTLMLVSLFFLSILLAVLFNDTLMNIHEFRRSFGIFKTIGMTPAQIRKALVYKVLALTTFGLAVGIPLALLVSPALISGITAGIGLAEFPFVFQGWGTALVAPGMLLFAGLSVWLASKRAQRISPRVLVST